ncbi:DUF2141 domain-containing protein [Azospirillum sp. SYSU D00513]|uniref:DUF2141 domain-containing protein n=1 Tax=Azospirillum sp. SYSU D00513 TaxID=2812561 RepID=UPI001A96B0CB|nr:DUF2141 domain-containing protein [Azospirillum sp. SYSU D00513]
MIPRLPTLALFLPLLALAPAGAAEPEKATLSGKAAACGDASDQVRLHVAVTGVRSGKGRVVVTVYGENPSDFLASGRKLARVRVPAAEGRTEVCLAVPPQASYGIAVYHDENGDEDFNRNLVGLPAEGFGFSHDAPATFGLPSYESVRFTAAPGDQQQDIAMRYR